MAIQGFIGFGGGATALQYAGASGEDPATVYGTASLGFRFNSSGSNPSAFGNATSNWSWHNSGSWGYESSSGVSNTGYMNAGGAAGFINLGDPYNGGSDWITRWNETDWSLSCWIKSSQAADSDNYSGNNRATLGTYMLGNNGNNCSGCFGTQAGYWGRGSANANHVSSTAVNSSNWRHCVMTNTYNGSNQATSRIYVDGSLDDTRTNYPTQQSTGQGINTNGLYILGGMYDYASNAALSKIDMFAIWTSTVLTDAQVEALYTGADAW